MNMPSLDTIPAEIFQEVGSYLAFFDKTSLSLTSKKCRALLGHFDCPDYFSWTGYLAMNTNCYPSYQQAYLLPKFKHPIDWYIFHDSFSPRPIYKDYAMERVESLEKRLRLHHSSLAKLGWFEAANEDGLHLEKPTNPRSSSQPMASFGLSPLMSEYFPGREYPECTLAYFYLKYIKEIVKPVNLPESKRKTSHGLRRRQSLWM